MTVNVGSLDRTLRAILGLILMILPFLGVWAGFQNMYVTYASVIVGIILLVTGLVGMCPIYSLLGLKTVGKT